MVWLVLISIVVLFFLWILFAPIELIIDSERRIYSVRALWVAGANLFEKDDPTIIVLKIFGFRKEIDPFEYKPERKKKKKPEEKKEKKKKKKKTKPFYKIDFPQLFRTVFVFLNKLRKTFNLKFLHVNIDTGDVILNARLAPISGFVYGEKVSFGVNFAGRNSVKFHISNSLGKIIFIAIPFALKIYRLIKK